jgi:hypothetical protein
MCLICDHLTAGNLTTDEAWRNLDEMAKGLGPEHEREVAALIVDREMDLIASGQLDVLNELMDDYTLEDAIIDMNFNFDDIELDFTT